MGLVIWILISFKILSPLNREDRHSAVGALLLDLAVALSDADRAFSTDGLFQDATLSGLGLGGEALDGLPSPFMLQHPAFLLFIMRQRISRQLGAPNLHFGPVFVWSPHFPTMVKPSLAS